MHNKFLILIVSSLIFSGCATTKGGARPSTQPNQGTPEAAQSTESKSPQVYGPEIEGAGKVYGPDPVVVHPVVLVLGPGAARGFATVGVIRALARSNVPIAAIYCTEMGSLIGSLYALSGNLNQFEWDLQKFKSTLFQTEENGIFSRFLALGSKEKKFEDQLKLTFNKHDLIDAKIPLRILVRSRHTERPVLNERGEIAQTVLESVFSTGIFQNSGKSGADNTSRKFSNKEILDLLIEEARKSATGPLLVVDTASEQSSGDLPLGQVGPTTASDEIIIRPKLNGIGEGEFSKRNESAYLGKSATTVLLPDIKKMAGLGVSKNGSE